MRCLICEHGINPNGPYWVQYLSAKQDQERQGYKFHVKCLAAFLARSLHEGGYAQDE